MSTDYAAQVRAAFARAGKPVSGVMVIAFERIGTNAEQHLSAYATDVSGSGIDMGKVEAAASAMIEVWFDTEAKDASRCDCDRCAARRLRLTRALAILNPEGTAGGTA